jgi:predicted dehydrogenase
MSMPLRTLIIGAGRAGRGLHLAGITRARALCPDGVFARQRPVAIDPSPRARGAALDEYDVDVRASLDAADHGHAASTVAHVCTPPLERVAIIRALAKLGYRDLLVEKPLATTRAELEQVESLAAAFGLRIGVVSPWLSSTLTMRLQEHMRAGDVGRVRRITVYQHKPRFSRTLEGVHHPTAFDVEVPHSVALALVLCGLDAVVVDAACRHMEIDGVVVPFLGAARLRLRHGAGVVVDIHSDLTAPVRRRTVRVEGETGALTGYYSICGDDHYAQLARAGRGTTRRSREIFRDEPFPRMLAQWYRGVAGIAPMPVSDLAFNRRVVELLCEAKRRAGVVDDAPAAGEPRPEEVASR